MTPAQISAFLKCFNQDLPEMDYEWVNCSCPLAPWTHQGGHDNNPSFGIRRNDTGQSIYKCWSCNEVGTVTDLVFRIRHLSRKFPKHVVYNLKYAMQLIAQEDEQNEDFVYKPIDYEDESNEMEEVIFPKNWLNSFFPAVTHPYLFERGVSNKVAKILDARVDIIDSRVCFPLISFDGALLGMQGRSFNGSHLPYKMYDFQGHFNPHVWGNEVNVNLDEPVVLCEGFFDMARIMSTYENTLCSLTSSLSDKKLSRLKDVEQIVTMYDVGTGGDVARKKIDKYFGSLYVVHVIPTKDQGDPGNMTDTEIKEVLSEHLLL